MIILPVVIKFCVVSVVFFLVVEGLSWEDEIDDLRFKSLDVDDFADIAPLLTESTILLAVTVVAVFICSIFGFVEFCEGKFADVGEVNGGFVVDNNEFF